MGSDPREAVGYSSSLEQQAVTLGHAPSQIARVIADSRGWVRVVAEDGEVDVEVHRSMSSTPEVVPVVGDWIVWEERPGMAPVVGSVLERTSEIARPNRRLRRTQTLAANVDVAWILEAVDAPHSWVRILRLATLVASGGVQPEVVLTKADLESDIANVQQLAADATLLPTWTCSVFAPTVQEELQARVQQLGERLGRVPTIALIGASGSGKSSLVNVFVPEAARATGTTRTDGRGRHTTTMRALIALPNGGCVVDTPGIRSVVVDEEVGGVHITFPDIEELGEQCKFRDCSHDHEPSCAVRAAVEAGELPMERLEAYLATLTQSRRN